MIEYEKYELHRWAHYPCVMIQQEYHHKVQN